ncbi:MAG: D-aminoacyl-tRNA deacylase [Planctomycetes bacterium]|nr:D-aminoacyl-tRNA deacylase [Planctomycetota bacterium]
MIDSHAHVDFESFDADRAEVLARAWAAGLAAIVNVGTGPAGSRRSVALAATDPRIWATVGIHPHDAGTATDADFAEIEALAREPRVVGIGECGLDRGPHNHAPFDAQVALFRQHVDLSRRTGLPLVIHNRDTYPELFAILEEETSARGPLRGVMHCFSGGPDEAARSVALGFHVSFSGVLTFKSAQKTRDAAKLVPGDRVMVETDCPFLTPEPHRGKRNEPAYTALTLARLASIRGWTMDEAAHVTARNTRQVFGLPAE